MNGFRNPVRGHPHTDVLRRVLAEREPARRSAPKATPAAVLIGLFDGPLGEPRVWLVRRPQGLRSHSGQVALPGGKRDPGDVDLVATALREADEEIGLPSSAVEVLGVSDEIVTSTGYHVTPIVGWIHEPFTPRPNPSEVSRAFSAPMDAFRDRGVLRALPLEVLRRMVRSYRVEGEIVWGLTAAILGGLVQRWRPETK
ncbi:MAG: CoA pyrophosphatase [Polyangiaceae bacterium]|nr:CoA pyrophosphatase [Polyangiaceae bacterium]